MRLMIAAIGRHKNVPEAALIDDYAARLRLGGRAVGLLSFDIVEIDAPKIADARRRSAREWELLSAAAPDGAKRVILDERGKALGSEAFARQIESWRNDRAPAAAFLIGGAGGHGEAAREGADLVLAFGPQTWPHMLARVMLCEQLYRAMTILSGHPYHRA
jgi:23S rRNA (pseudouridine1915-N3)-methyltransferase